MSEQTQTRTFQRGQAPKLPIVACLGYVSEVGEAGVGKSGNYHVIPINIEGKGSARGKTQYFCFRPEWMSADFDPQTLEGAEGNPLFVYGKNISTVEDDPTLLTGKGEIKGLLAGLSGSPERYSELQDKLLSLAENGEVGEDDVQAVLDEFLSPVEGQEPRTIGYILQQERIKTGLLDEDGKPKYIRGKNYEVRGFFFVNKENIAKYRKQAEKAAKRAAEKKEKPNFVVAFDEDVPF